MHLFYAWPGVQYCGLNVVPLKISSICTGARRELSLTSSGIFDTYFIGSEDFSIGLKLRP